MFWAFFLELIFTFVSKRRELINKFTTIEFSYTSSKVHYISSSYFNVCLILFVELLRRRLYFLLFLYFSLITLKLMCMFYTCFLYRKQNVFKKLSEWCALPNSTELVLLPNIFQFYFTVQVWSWRSWVLSLFNLLRRYLMSLYVSSLRWYVFPFLPIILRTIVEADFQPAAHFYSFVHIFPGASMPRYRLGEIVVDIYEFSVCSYCYIRK